MIILDCVNGLMILIYGPVFGLLLNLIVAIGEIYLIEYIFKAKCKWNPIIVGNYVSLLLGTIACILLNNYFYHHLKWHSLDLYYKYSIPIFFTILFILTLIVEFPFYIRALKSIFPMKKIILTTFFVNLISTIFVIILYYLTSGFSFLKLLVK